jgi:hypothetical protein
MRLRHAGRLHALARTKDTGPPSFTELEMMELSAIAYQQPIIRDGLSPLAGHHISREILVETSERDGFEKPLRRHPGDRRAGSRRERAGGDAWRSRRDEKLRARPAIYNTDLASAPRELLKALNRTFPGVVTLALGAFTIPVTKLDT